jgi:outer membrane protein assembly factor BamB
VAVARRTAKVVWVLLVALAGLDALGLAPPPADCVGPNPSALTRGGASAAAGTARWRIAIECGGAQDSPAWSSSDDHEGDERAVALRSRVFAAGDLLVVATPGSRVVNAYDLSTGLPRWSHDLGAGRAARVGSGSARWIWISSSIPDNHSKRHLVLDARTGVPLWQRPFADLGETLHIVGDTAVLEVWGVLVGVDPQTGHERWRHAIPPGSTFRHDDKFAYFIGPVGVPVARRTEVWRVDLRTGEVSPVRRWPSAV